MSSYYADVQQATTMIKNLDRWLDKAVEHAQQKKFEPSVLLQARLAPDMYPLTRQIQAACDGAKFLAARLSGKDAPKHADSDTQSLEELRARIQSVLQYLASFGPKDFENAEGRIVPLGFLPGKGIAAPDFLRQLNVPNTYFHLCMAYAILRNNGVSLGKSDYITDMTLRDL